MDDLLTTLAAPPLLFLYAVTLVYLGCVLVVHFRGEARLRFERQLTEHSGLLAPLNVLFYATSAVPKDPILETDRFPQLALLRENWETIREEALALFEGGRIAYGDGISDLTFLSFKKLGWKRFHLRWYGDFLPSALEACPKTVELVKQVPGLNSAAFTMLPPGGRLGAHRDPIASSLRYHLALVAPKQPGCTLFVDGQPIEWKDGEDFVFDETYVHWAENPTDEPRIVFFADITRPLKPGPIRWLNDFLIKHVYHVTGSHNEATEPKGALNRITPVFHGLKRFFRGIKGRVNRKLYYGVKYALGACLLFLVIRWIAA